MCASNASSRFGDALDLMTRVTQRLDVAVGFGATFSQRHNVIANSRRCHTLLLEAGHTEGLFLEQARTQSLQGGATNAGLFPIAIPAGTRATLCDAWRKVWHYPPPTQSA